MTVAAPAWLPGPGEPEPMSPEATADQLEANLSRLSAKDRDFASSLIASARSPRGVSDRQLEWLVKLHERATAPAVAPASGLSVASSLSPVVAMFDAAKASGLKWPFVMLHADGGALTLKLKVAGENSRTPGALMVAGEGPFNVAPFYGHVDAAGVFHVRDAWKGTASATAIARALEAFALDPAGTAKAYGVATGSCCFCARELTDARSLSAGYGPTCADRFGLPWGESATVEPVQAVLL